MKNLRIRVPTSLFNKLKRLSKKSNTDIESLITDLLEAAELPKLSKPKKVDKCNLSKEDQDYQDLLDYINKMKNG